MKWRRLGGGGMGEPARGGVGVAKGNYKAIFIENTSPIDPQIRYLK